MNRRGKERSDDSLESEIGSFFWYVLILTTLACLSGWFAPNTYIGTSIATIAAAVGWLYVILDARTVNRRNKQRMEEYLKNKKGEQSNEKS